MTEPLPENWHWSTLGDIAKWGSGGTPKRNEKSYYNGDIPWAIIGDLNDGIVESCKNSITEAGLAYSNCKTLKAGTLLVAIYGSIGKLGIAGMPMATNQAIAFAIPHINVRYLFNYLLSQRSTLNAAGKGATQKNISQTVLKAWPIPVAPCLEQERIAVAIEEHFSRIDAAESAAQTALTRLDTLRRAILTAAFSGYLVEPLNPRRTPDGLPEDWILHTLDEIMQDSLFSDGDWVESKDQDPSGSVRLIQLADIGEGAFRNRSNRWLNEPTAERLRCTYLREDDVLIARMPDPIGRACLMPYSESRSVTVVDVCILRPNPNNLFAPWLMWGFNSPSFRIRVEALQSGTTRKRISRKNLSTISIPLPPLEDQKRIVAAIEEQFSRVDSAKTTLERCLQRCSLLRRSILSAAFSGRLVEQDPNDEPASVLLERIAIEQPKRRTRRRSA